MTPPGLSQRHPPLPNKIQRMSILCSVRARLWAVNSTVVKHQMLLKTLTGALHVCIPSRHTVMNLRDMGFCVSENLVLKHGSRYCLFKSRISKNPVLQKLNFGCKIWLALLTYVYHTCFWKFGHYILLYIQGQICRWLHWLEQIKLKLLIILSLILMYFTLNRVGWE